MKTLSAHPLFAALGLLAPLLAIIVATNNVVPILLKWSGRPECVWYADTYRSPVGIFRKEGNVWKEYQWGDDTNLQSDRAALIARNAQYQFNEIYRSRDYIDLQNITPRPHLHWQTMIVRIPTCGGDVSYTHEVGVPRVSLYWVNPE